jgi:serine/threonine protein kinase
MTTPEPPSTDSDNPGALPVGTRLGEYELRSVIGVGGFGIVYLAFDHALEREVAIKEYMPASLATRSQSVKVAPLSQSVTENFETGLRSFVNEGRMLARFDSPSLLKVYRYWEANGTAYITMPLYRGRTLKEHRAAMSTPPDEAAARALLMPLLSAVDLLHRESIYHRDIAPDNILVEAGNRPVLLDFGAARRVIGEKSQALTAILKPAYAPIEQYGEAASVKQGAWTDLYALGATMHFYLLGQAPPPSTTRAVQDEMQPLAERELPGCSKAFLKIIDWMLAPRPSDRPQSVAALVEVLEGRAEVPVRAVARAEAAASNEAQRTQLLPVRREQAAPVGVDIPLDAAPPPPPPARPPTSPPMPPAPSVAPPAPAAVATGSGGRWALPAAAVGLLLAATAWWFWPRKPLPSPPPPPVAAMPAAAPAAAPRPEPAPPPKGPMVVSPSPGPAEAQIATVPTPKPKVAEAPRPPAPAASARRTKPSGPAPEPEGARPLVEAAPTPQSRPAEPTPAKAAARPSAPAPSPASAAAVVKGPRETCGRRVFVALVNCMNRECAKPENRRLAECSLYRPPN